MQTALSIFPTYQGLFLIVIFLFLNLIILRFIIDSSLLNTQTAAAAAAMLSLPPTLPFPSLIPVSLPMIDHTTRHLIMSVSIIIRKKLFYFSTKLANL